MIDKDVGGDDRRLYIDESELDTLHTGERCRKGVSRDYIEKEGA